MRKVPTQWPKPVFRLTAEEADIKKQVCLEFQDWGYTGLLGWIQDQGHKQVERFSRVNSSKSKERFLSLEVGCGSGRHFEFVKKGTHVGLDSSIEHLLKAQKKYPYFPWVTGDVYSLPFKSSIFDRVVSVYLFEHLHNLPEGLEEIHRVLRPGGELTVGLPAEGGLLYNLGRRFTSKRYFDQKYGIDYLRLVRSEHCNSCQEVIEEIRSFFRVYEIRYLPLFLPAVHLNAIVTLSCVNDKPEGGI